jgi:hypothetical protein
LLYWWWCSSIPSICPFLAVIGDVGSEEVPDDMVPLLLPVSMASSGDSDSDDAIDVVEDDDDAFAAAVAVAAATATTVDAAALAAAMPATRPRARSRMAGVPTAPPLFLMVLLLSRGTLSTSSLSPGGCDGIATDEVAIEVKS